jgi:hypothetical protein
MDPDLTTRNQQGRQQQQQHTMGHSDYEEHEDQQQHILASDSDDDSDNYTSRQQHRSRNVGTDNTISISAHRGSSGESSSSTIVSVDSNPDSPPPKYDRESFEFAEPTNQSLGHSSDPEACLNSPRYEGNSEKGLGSQVMSHFYFHLLFFRHCA